MTSYSHTQKSSSSSGWLNWYSTNIGSKLDELCACSAISSCHILHEDDLNAREWDGGSVVATVHEETKLDDFFQDHSLAFQNERPAQQRQRRVSGIEESKSNQDDEEDDIVDPNHPNFTSPSSTATAFFPPNMPVYFASTAIGMSSVRQPTSTSTFNTAQHSGGRPSTPMNDETMRTIASIHHKETMPTENTALGKIERALEHVVKLHPRPRDMNDSSLGLRRIRLATPIVSKPTIEKRLSSMDDSQRDPSPATYFENIPCFSRLVTAGDQHQPAAPISPGDTCTTVSLSHSFDNSCLMDDDEEEDDCVVGMERNGSTISTQIASNCFREPPCFTPRRVEKKSPSLPMIPDPSSTEQGQPLYLLRMKPQNYVHQDDCEEDNKFFLRSPTETASKRAPPTFLKKVCVTVSPQTSTEEVDVAV